MEKSLWFTISIDQQVPGTPETLHDYRDINSNGKKEKTEEVTMSGGGEWTPKWQALILYTCIH